MRTGKTMKHYDNDFLADAWQFFVSSRRWILITVLVLLAACAMSQERAVLVASSKIKASTNFLVCVETKDGKRYSFKYNVHCYRCQVVNIPTYWDILKKRRRTFIKPVI